MTTIRSLIAITTVLATSLSAMHNQDGQLSVRKKRDMLSLRNLCLKTIATHSERSTKILSGSSTLVDQTISAIVTGIFEDLLKLDMAKRLSPNDIKPYCKALWNYIKTFDLADITEKQCQTNAAVLLAKELISKMPKEFLTSHLHELLELSNVSLILKCHLVEENTLLQTTQIFKLVCAQGPVSQEIRKLMVKQFLKEKAPTGKKNEHMQVAITPHEKEKINPDPQPKSATESKKSKNLISRHRCVIL